MNPTRRLSLKREALTELTSDDLSIVAGANAITTTCKTLLDLLTIVEQTMRYCSFMPGCASNTYACTYDC